MLCKKKKQVNPASFHIKDMRGILKKSDSIERFNDRKAVIESFH
jgi:hypothetical protein